MKTEIDVDCLMVEFNNNFKTEDECLAEIYRAAKEAGLLRCRYCRKAHARRISGSRWLKCSNCKILTSLTARTLFHGIRLARPWLVAIWFMEHGVVLSSVQLHKLAGIAQSSALNILRKITTAIRENMKNSVEAPSELFYEVLCRRSRETPARKHPQAEQDEVNDVNSTTGQFTRSEGKDVKSKPFYASDYTNNLESNRLQLQVQTEPTGPFKSLVELESLNQDRHTELARVAGSLEPLPSGKTTEEHLARAAGPSLPTDPQTKILECLSHGAVTEDVLCDRTGLGAGDLAAPLLFLELAGTIESQPGNKFVLCIPKLQCQRANEIPDRLKLLITGISAFIRLKFHGISRKYLQNYLAAYWCQVARTTWCEGSIMKLCLLFHPVSYRDILEYVSPINIKIANAIEIEPCV